MTALPPYVEPGQVIRVHDWPGTFGERYAVTEIRHVPKSPWPIQVYALLIEQVNGAERLTAFHAFPLENVEVDEAATERRERLMARVAERTGR